MARSLNSLKNEDYSDRELLHMIQDHADEDGFTTTADIQDTLGIRMPTNGDGKRPSKEDDNFHGRRCVATRFAWMVRFGFCVRNEDRTKWGLTEEGYDLMNGRLTNALQKALDKLDPGDRVLLMRELGQSYLSQSDAAQAMIRREWQRTARRRA